ncbi:SMI1/KNR4 family protein [Streptomyces sp. 1331.2]|uniref:SMI1/KNR4 family protein n=1 Tax=Streptomyces sp. 1331.2 TaxID=1938835 RepID=UPI000BC366F3|nr:SMI1/KNR4 family protein [Streptomyces sp. 1331.2]SOB85317.1 SMI1-KNR4 cell-wall [Streptomyces sp. 1331.2]
MEFEEFEAKLVAARAKRAGLNSPEGFDVFEFRTASEDDLMVAEEALGARLPGEYKEFMKRYGGGMFLFLDLLPIASSDDQEDDLLKVNLREFLDADFIAVAPVGTGDWWGFSVIDGRCADQINFWDHEDGRVQFEAASFLDFLAHEGLRAGR